MEEKFKFEGEKEPEKFKIDIKEAEGYKIRGEFNDKWGRECAIIDATAGEEKPEPAIYLGLEKDADGNEIKGHMLLTQEMAKELIPVLQRFVERGSIKEN